MRIFEFDDDSVDYSSTAFYKTFGDVLYHVAYESDKEGFHAFNYRGEPKDTSMAFHKEVNKLAKQALGIPIRNLLFAVPSVRGAKNLIPSGTVYHVYPVSKNFKIFYGKNVADMTTDFSVTSDNLPTKSRLVVENAIYKELRNDKNIDPTVREKTMNAIGSVVSRAVMINDNRNISDLKELFDNASIETRKELKKLSIGSDIINMVIDTLQKVKTFYENKALEYINSIVEIKSEEELGNVSNFTEIMVYDPKGFIFKGYKKDS